MFDRDFTGFGHDRSSHHSHFKQSSHGTIDRIANRAKRVVEAIFGTDPESREEDQMRQRAKHRKRHRMQFLDPNMGFSTRVEKYTFAVNQREPLTIGVRSQVCLAGQPATSIRPTSLHVNVPIPNFVLYSDIKVANLAISIGGDGDAWEFSQGGGCSIEAPTLTPALTFAFIGSYTGSEAPYLHAAPKKRDPVKVRPDLPFKAMMIEWAYLQAMKKIAPVSLAPSHSPASEFTLTAAVHGPSTIAG